MEEAYFCGSEYLKIVFSVLVRAWKKAAAVIQVG